MRLNREGVKRKLAQSSLTWSLRDLFGGRVLAFGLDSRRVGDPGGGAGLPEVFLQSFDGPIQLIGSDLEVNVHEICKQKQNVRLNRSSRSDRQVTARRQPTLVSSVFHQPAGDADDVLEHGFGQVLQHHLLRHLQLLVHADGIQDEDGGDGLAVAGQEVAELRLQQLFSLLKTGFLQAEADFGLLKGKKCQIKR